MKFAKFFEIIAVEQVRNILQELTEKIDQGKRKNELESELNKLQILYKNWKPIIDIYFPSAMQTIVLKINDK